MTNTLPAGFVEIDRWDVNRVPTWQVGVVLVGGLVALFVTANVALGVLYLVNGVVEYRLAVPSLVVGLVLGLALHESSHAVAFLAFGGRPRLGRQAKTRLGPILYVSAPGSYFRRAQYLMAGLGAVGVLTLLLLLVVAVAPAGGTVSSSAIVAVSLSVGGAAGDALIARAVLSYPASAVFEDTGDGFIVYGPARLRDSA